MMPDKEEDGAIPRRSQTPVVTHEAPKALAQKPSSGPAVGHQETPSATSPPLSIAPSEASSPGVRLHVRFLHALCLVLLFTPLFLAAIDPRVPTVVSINVTARSLTFTTANGAPVAFLTPRGRLASLSFDHFREVKFAKGQLWQAADPKQYDAAKDSYPIPAWHRLAVPTAVTVTGEPGQNDAQITFGGLRRKDGPFSLDPISVADKDRITLATTTGSPSSLSMSIQGQHQDCRVIPLSPFQVTTIDCRAAGIGGFPNLLTAQSVQYRLDPTASNTGGGDVQVSGMPMTIGIHLRMPDDMASANERSTGLFPTQAIEISAVEFSNQDSHSGSIISSLSQATVAYPDYPKCGPVPLAGPDLLVLGRLHDFRIHHIGLQSDGEFMVTMEGRADQIQGGEEHRLRDLRLGMLDVANNTPYAVPLGVLSSLMAVFGVLYSIARNHVQHIRGKPTKRTEGEPDAGSKR